MPSFILKLSDIVILDLKRHQKIFGRFSLSIFQVNLRNATSQIVRHSWINGVFWNIKILRFTNLGSFFIIILNINNFKFVIILNFKFVITLAILTLLRLLRLFFRLWGWLYRFRIILKLLLFNRNLSNVSRIWWSLLRLIFQRQHFEV